MVTGSVSRRGAAFNARVRLKYNRNVYLLLLFTLGKGFQLSIAALSTNLYVFSLGYPKDFVGLIAAIPAIGALVAGVPIGLLADRVGRKPILLVSGLLNPVALVAIAFSTSAPLLIVASLCNGLLAGGYWVINLPMLTESTNDDQRVGALALNSFLLLGVGALGALIGGFVPEVVGGLVHMPANSVIPLRWGLLSAALIVFLPAVPLVFLREPRRISRGAPSIPAAPIPAESPAMPRAESAPAEMAVGAQPAAAANDPIGRRAITLLFVKLLIPDVLFTTGEGVVIGLLQIYLVLRFHISPGTLGVLYTAAGLTGGATSLLAPRLVRRWGSVRTAATMQYLSIPAMLTIGFAPFFPLAAGGEFARATLRGFFEPVYAAFAMQSVPPRLRATLSGFYSTTWSVGFTVGPALAGVLQQHVNLSAPFLVGIVCIGSSASLLLTFFGRSTRPARAG